MQLSEAKTAVAAKLDIDYTDIANNGLFSASDILEYILTACKRAWDFKRWDFTEGSKTLTLSSTQVTDTYIDYPTDFGAGSVHLVKINGKEFKKIRYQDYLKYLEDNPSGTKRIVAEYKRYLFFNPNAVSAGQIMDIYGKLKFQTISADADLLPFSDAETDNQESSGNDAIILLAYAEALGSEKKKKPTEARVQEQKAIAILTGLWIPMEENNALEQNMRPAFNVPNFFGSSRNGGTDAAGKFDYDN